MDNLEAKDGGELKKSRLRTIKKFEKPPPLKISGKAERRETNSTIQDKVSVSTPVVEVSHSIQMQCKNNLFKSESNIPAQTLKNNLSSIEDKYEYSNGNISKGSNTMPANRRLSSLVNRLKQLQVAANKIPQEKINLQNNLSSITKNENNEKSSCLNNKVTSKLFATNGTSSQINGSEDKNEIWSLYSTTWSTDVQVKSKEISCALSLKGILILTNMYSGSLCSTKEYSKSTPLKTLNPAKNHDCNLSKKMLSVDQTSRENSSLIEADKISQPNTNGSLQNENGFSSDVKSANGCRSRQKEDNREENQYTIDTTSKKSRMSMLLDRLNSETHSEPSLLNDSVPTVLPKLPPGNASSNPSTPYKSKPPSSTGSSPAKAASTNSKSSGARQGGTCYNCGQEGHFFYKCPQPSIGKFCRRCGWEDVDTEKCPFCTGTLVRPGSTRPVPVGGDKCRKYPNIELSDVRRQYEEDSARKGTKFR